MRLAAAALHLARDEYATLDVCAQLRQLDAQAERVRIACDCESPAGRIEALREVLVEQLDYRANQENYYDPQNSYLNVVIERRRGIPISLAAVWLDAAWKLNWPLVGIGFPGHFLVGYRHERGIALLDPYHGGKTVSRAECMERLRCAYGEGAVWRDEFVQPVGARTILTRMLNNLRNIYVELRDWRRVERVLRRLAKLQPEAPSVARELGLMALRRGGFAEAVCWLERSLSLTDADDDTRGLIEDELRVARLSWARQN